MRGIYQGRCDMAGFFKRDDEPLAHFRLRMVTLHTYHPVEGKPNRQQIDPASGFLARVGETVWLFTAGHVIDDIRQTRDADLLDGIYVADAWTGPDGKGTYVVVPRDSEVVSFGNVDSPPDIGAIKIDPFTASTFNQKMQPVPETHWHDQPTIF